MAREPSAEADAIRWVRKRDQTLVPCDRAQLRETLLAAGEDAGQPLAAEEADELAQLVLFMAGKVSDDGTVSSEELADWVVKSLENTGRAALATAYRDFAHRRAAFRARARHIPASDPSGEQPWDKSWLRRLLEDRTTLAPAECARVARRVEQILVRSDLTTLTDELICAVANAVLQQLGHRCRIEPPELIRIAARDSVPRAGHSPEVAAWRVADAVWRQRALAHELPPEAVHMHRQGPMKLAGPWPPLQLAALSIDAAGLTRQAASASEFLPLLARTLAELRPYAGKLLAVDLVDVAIALCTDSEEAAYELAEAVWTEFQSQAIHAPVDLVINLYGRVPPRAYGHVAPGPLFRAVPDAQLANRARAAAEVLLDRFRNAGHELPRLTVDFHWVPELPERLERPAHAALAVALTGGRLRFVLDRYVSAAGDGLPSGSHAASLLVAELDMCQLLGQSGDDPSGWVRELFEPACELLLRVAVRRREQLREQLPVDPALHRRLQHAAVVLCPIGLDAAVRRLTGHGIAEHPTGTAAAVACIDTLRRRAERLSSGYALSVRVDRARPTLVEPEASDVAFTDRLPGLTSWAPGRGLREQIYRTGQIHRRARGGTLLVPLTQPGAWTPEFVCESLNWAYETSSIVRLQFVPDVENQVALWPAEEVR